MQEQLQWPVIPVTIHGAYELFPIKTYFNECGRVVVRFNRPIEAADIKSRDSLAQRLRKVSKEEGESVGVCVCVPGLTSPRETRGLTCPTHAFAG